MAQLHVSVLVPTYNQTEFLIRCFESVLAQDVDGMEIVVIDNASTDDTWDLCRDVAGRDARVRLLRNERNLGRNGNILRCISEARGTFVKFALSDDVLYPGAVELLLDAISSDDHIQLATSHWDIIDEHDKIHDDTERLRLPIDQDTVVDGHALGNRMLVDTANYVGTKSSVMFRSASVDVDAPNVVDGRSPECAWELGLWMNLLSQGPAAYVARPLSAWRVTTARREATYASENLGVWRDWWLLVQAVPALGFLRDEWDRRLTRIRLLELGTTILRVLSEAIRASDESPARIHGMPTAELYRGVDELADALADVAHTIPPIESARP